MVGVVAQMACAALCACGGMPQHIQEIINMEGWASERKVINVQGITDDGQNCIHQLHSIGDILSIMY